MAVREGCEAREKKISANSPRPMDVDAMNEVDVVSPPSSPEGSVDAVHNPNITCYLCREKGHIARNCPHQADKGKGKGGKSGGSPQPPWWYGGKSPKGGKGGKGKGSGKSYGYQSYGFVPYNASKGKGKAYSVESQAPAQADHGAWDPA